MRLSIVPAPPAAAASASLSAAAPAGCRRGASAAGGACRAGCSTAPPSAAAPPWPSPEAASAACALSGCTLPRPLAAARRARVTGRRDATSAAAILRAIAALLVWSALLGRCSRCACCTRSSRCCCSCTSARSAAARSASDAASLPAGCCAVTPPVPAAGCRAPPAAARSCREAAASALARLPWRVRERWACLHVAAQLLLDACPGAACSDWLAQVGTKQEHVVRREAEVRGHACARTSRGRDRRQLRKRHWRGEHGPQCGRCRSAPRCTTPRSRARRTRRPRRSPSPACAWPHAATLFNHTPLSPLGCL